MVASFITTVCPPALSARAASLHAGRCDADGQQGGCDGRYMLGGSSHDFLPVCSWCSDARKSTGSWEPEEPRGPLRETRLRAATRRRHNGCAHEGCRLRGGGRRDGAGRPHAGAGGRAAPGRDRSRTPSWPCHRWCSPAGSCSSSCPPPASGWRRRGNWSPRPGLALAQAGALLHWQRPGTGSRRGSRSDCSPSAPCSPSGSPSRVGSACRPGAGPSASRAPRRSSSACSTYDPFSDPGCARTCTEVAAAWRLGARGSGLLTHGLTVVAAALALVVVARTSRRTRPGGAAALLVVAATGWCG